MARRLSLAFRCASRHPFQCLISSVGLVKLGALYLNVPVASEADDNSLKMNERRSRDFFLSFEIEWMDIFRTFLEFGIQCRAMCPILIIGNGWRYGVDAQYTRCKGLI